MTGAGREPVTRADFGKVSNLGQEPSQRDDIVSDIRLSSNGKRLCPYVVLLYPRMKGAIAQSFRRSVQDDDLPSLPDLPGREHGHDVFKDARGGGCLTKPAGPPT